MKKNIKAVLDTEEQITEETLIKGHYKSTKDLKERKLFFEKATENYKELQKTKPITIRVNKLDIIKLKARAQEKQIPYQTLLSSLIRQYVSGEAKIKL